jgi:prepilin-type N-terminal cleavage/methylation domain-containing protein
MRKSRAFTLIEVLVVVSIIALLLSIMMPSLREVRRISKRTVCQKNLDQIGVGMQAYLLNSTPKDTFPYACRLPSWERLQAEKDNRRPLPPLPEVLRNELKSNKAVYDKKQEQSRTNEVFGCPADQNTMSKMGDSGISDPEEAIPTDRYFDHEGTSYEWESNLNGTKLDFKLIRIYGRVGKDDARVRKFEIAKIPRNNMWMLFDFEAFHGGPTMRGSHNVLYTDLHVETDKWDENKRVGKALQ